MRGKGALLVFEALFIILYLLDDYLSQLFRVVFLGQVLLADGVSYPLGAATSLANAAIWQATSDSIVANLDVAFVIDQNISRLEIPMDNISSMKIFDTTKQVVKSEDQVSFRELTVVAETD